MSRKHTNAAISEAVRWFHRFQMKGPTALSPDESAEWARWAANKNNLAAFQQAEKLWDNLRHLKKESCPTQQELDADGYDPEQTVSEWLTKGESGKPGR